MTKDECTAYLTGKGFPAENENGVVMVRKERPLSEEERNEVRSLMREAGYNASYGFGVRRK